MKFHTRRLLSLLLMLSLFVSLLSVGAYAVDVPEITCELGTALDYTIPLEGDDSADGYEIVGGSLPSGLTVELKDGAVKLVGTPDAGGDYSCTIKITGASGAEAEYVLTIKIIDPTPEPTPSPIPVPAPSITKDPTDGTVLEGEYATFIASADYADKIEWRFVNPKNDDSVNARDVGSRFPGTHCEGYDEETLVVYNIRYEMNGWEAVCKFTGNGGSAFSKGARITVTKNGPLPPSITKDPVVTSGSDKLSVTATDPNNGVLNYQWYSSADNSNANDDGKDVKIAGATSATYVPPETPGTVYYYCAVWSTIDGQKSIEVKSRVAAVTHVPAPSITKDPTGEIVLEGEYAIFIARADYADQIEWRFVNPKNDDSVNARDVGSRFPGTHCEGYDEETLVVYNIRYEMNGWEAVCKFTGNGGSAFSKGARITVTKNGPLPPSITKDPVVTSGSDKLSVTATDPNNGVLNYQWYSSADNSNANDDGKDVKIAGATSATYVPPETPGTVYYYCAVWSTVDGQKSIEAKSRVAAVTHAIQPTPEPTPAPTPEPTPPPPEPSAEPSALSGRSSSRFLLILMGVLILALIAAAVSLVIISRKERELGEEDEDEEEEKRLRSEEASRVFKAAPAKVPAPPAVPVAAAVPDEPAAETAVSDAEAKIDPEGFVLDGWYCVKCGSFNRGHNCTACGAEKPKEAIQYVCDRCGWTNPDPEHPPRFCPDCGAPYAAADDDR